jgi:hypothetical protein
MTNEINADGIQITRGPLPGDYPASVTQEVVIRQIEYGSPKDIGYWSYPSDFAIEESNITSVSHLVATFRVKLKPRTN